MAEKQGPYPTQDPGQTVYTGAPPAYPGVGGPAPAGYQPPPAGYQPPPAGYQPPTGYQPPPPGVQPYPGQPMTHQPGPPPPPGSYVAGQPVVQNTVMYVGNMFRQSPANCVCPHCHQNVITATESEAGGLAWLLCAGICLFGFWLGCCLIPFCIDECKDIRHSCPNCKNTIHVFRRL